MKLLNELYWFRFLLTHFWSIMRLNRSLWMNNILGMRKAQLTPMRCFSIQNERIFCTFLVARCANPVESGDFCRFQKNILSLQNIWNPIFRLRFFYLYVFYLDELITDQQSIYQRIFNENNRIDILNSREVFLVEIKRNRIHENRSVCIIIFRHLRWTWDSIPI